MTTATGDSIFSSILFFSLSDRLCGFACIYLNCFTNVASFSGWSLPTVTSLNAFEALIVSYSFSKRMS
jgi:hypothetical protein